MFSKSPQLSKHKFVVVGAVILVMLVAVIITLVVWLQYDDDYDDSFRDAPSEAPGPSNSVLGVYWNAAVSTNGYPCAIIGRDILMRNGSAVEAAIAALFCDGVVCPQSMGVGGGFFMTIYKRETRQVETLDARETAPSQATEDMYKGNSNLMKEGGLAVAVPGELKGYYEAFLKYGSGNVAWKDLVEPTIALCDEGITVTSYLRKALERSEKFIRAHPSLSEVLINQETNQLWNVGEKIKRPQLKKTLEIVSEDPYSLYNGTLMTQFVQDVQTLGGIITEDDMRNYEVVWGEPLEADLRDNITMYTSPLPGSGPILAFIFNIMDSFITSNDSEALKIHRITEAYKYAYGKRTLLGDPGDVDIAAVVKEVVEEMTSMEYARKISKQIKDTSTHQNATHYGVQLYVPEDHGTANIAVLAPNGDAVCVTSTVNLLFGAKVRSRQTGIILNNEMDDFSAPYITNAFDIPPSPNNFIKPGKRPLSSMAPSIFVDKSTGDVRLVLGAAGGTKITTSIAQVAINTLWYQMDIKEAVDDRRFHHQLFPMHLQYEPGIVKDVLRGLNKIGHVLEKNEPFGSSVTAIEKKNGMVYANSDFRRLGIVAGF